MQSYSLTSTTTTTTMQTYNTTSTPIINGRYEVYTQNQRNVGDEDASSSPKHVRIPSTTTSMTWPTTMMTTPMTTTPPPPMNRHRQMPAVVSPHHHQHYNDPPSPPPPPLQQQHQHQQQQLDSPSGGGLSFFYFANRVVALDCEMVGVGPFGQRSVLARVSLVNFFGHVLFDTFVRVEEKVTDYRTHVSGVQARDLTSPWAMSFSACRNRVKDLVRNKILVGHGLQNDLSVLGIDDHPWYNIRDTTMYRPYMKVDHSTGHYLPRRLKELARTHLGIVIQQDGLSHNSLEDACAAMALYRQVQSQWDCEMDSKRRDAVLQTRLRDMATAC